MKANKVIGIIAGAVVLATVSYLLAMYYAGESKQAVAVPDPADTVAPPEITNVPGLQRVRVNIEQDEQCIIPEEMVVEFTQPILSTNKNWY